MFYNNWPAVPLICMAAMTMDSGQCTLGTTTPTPAFTKARSGIKGTNYIVYLPHKSNSPCFVADKHTIQHVHQSATAFPWHVRDSLLCELVTTITH